MPVTIPCVTGKLVIRLWDYDTAGSNDIIGTVSFNWAEIKAGTYSDYFWANIYGAPLGVSGPNTDKMNSMPNTASYWRGRILMRLT
jgi:hypothetical protein